MGAIQYLILLAGLLVAATQGAYIDDKDYDYDYDDEYEQCEIHSDYTSPYVTAYYERVDVAVGCVSQERSPDGKEVHVINIQSPSNADKSERTDAGPTEVTLQLRPRNNSGTFSGRTLFVLNSALPVVWRVTTQRMSNATRHLFWMSRTSRLKNKEEVPLRIKVKKQDMPHGTDALVAWVRRQAEAGGPGEAAEGGGPQPTGGRPGAITSFTEVQQQNVVNTIIVKTGIDSGSTATCEISSSSYAPRPDAAAFALHVQTTNACQAPRNLGYHDHDVHILEVHASDTSPPHTHSSDIVLEISANARKPPPVNIILGLRSHRSNVRWRIQARGIKGQILIFTDSEVDTGAVESQLQSLSVAAERLDGLTGAGLVEWTRERYGPAVSYTEADVANKFTLLIDGNNNGELVPSGRARSPFQQPSQTLQAVIRARSVDCQTQAIRIVLSKKTLNQYGVFREHLSLIDENCMAVDNRTHYILETRLDECGTSSVVAADRVTYQNAILVKKLGEGVHIDLEDFSGSGYDVAAGGEAGGQADTHVDDEDLGGGGEVDIIHSEFSCHYNVGQQSSPRYKLDLFISEEFEEPVKPEQFPVQVPENANVYVQATMDGDTDLSLVVEHCKVNSPNSAQSHLLIRNRCAVDPSLSKLSAPDPHTYRFSFTFQEYALQRRGEGEAGYYITCQINACTNTGTHGPNIKQCSSLLAEEQLSCMSSGSRTAATATAAVSPRVAGEEDIPLDFGREVFVGPLVAGGQDDSSGMEWVDAGPGCQQKSHQNSQGLDSATVVGIAFAAFVIGVCLVASLWFIHSKTGAKRSRQRFVETSGESTPSSTAPITIHQVNQHT